LLKPKNSNASNKCVLTEAAAAPPRERLDQASCNGTTEEEKEATGALLLVFPSSLSPSRWRIPDADLLRATRLLLELADGGRILPMLKPVPSSSSILLLLVRQVPLLLPLPSLPWYVPAEQPRPSRAPRFSNRARWYAIHNEEKRLKDEERARDRGGKRERAGEVT